MNVQRKTVNIPVPAGVENGQTVRMSVGKQEIFITFKLVWIGSAYSGQRLITFTFNLNRVERSDYFRRDGADVHTDAEISAAQALLGGAICIQGVYETQHIQVYVEQYVSSSVK